MIIDAVCVVGQIYKLHSHTISTTMNFESGSSACETRNAEID